MPHTAATRRSPSRLDVARELVPRASRMAILGTRASFIAEMAPVEQAQEIHLHGIGVDGPADLERAFSMNMDDEDASGVEFIATRPSQLKSFTLTPSAMGVSFPAAPRAEFYRGSSYACPAHPASPRHRGEEPLGGFVSAC